MIEPTIGARVQYTAGQAFLADRTGVVKVIDKSLGGLWELVVTLDKPMIVDAFGEVIEYTEWQALWSPLLGASSVRVLEEE